MRHSTTPGRSCHPNGSCHRSRFPETQPPRTATPIAEDGNLGSLNLDSLIVKHRASTFFWRLEAAVPELHWKSGSLLVVDRALTPKHGSVGVMVADSEHVLARFSKTTPFRLDGSNFDGEVSLWGVVTYCIQSLEKDVS